MENKENKELEEKEKNEFLAEVYRKPEEAEESVKTARFMTHGKCLRK